MANDFYNASGTPGTDAFAASAAMRSEFSAIAAGFDLLPTLSAGTAARAVVINAAGTALGVTVGVLALAGNFTITGNFATTLVAGADVSLTLPLVSGTLATLTGIETLTNKTFVAPALGTPASGVLTHCTGTAAGLTAGTALVVATNANMTGPISSVGNVTSITSQTGTGTKFVVDTSPTLVTPVLGVAVATSINKVQITPPATAATLTIADGKTFVANASITLAGTDSTTMTFPATSATLARTDAANTFTGVQTFNTPIATASVATMTATVGGGVPTPPNNTTTFLRGDGTFAAPSAGGTVPSVSIVTANGVSGSVATATSTPAITLTLGAITPSSVNGNTITTGSGTLTLGAGKTATISNTLTLAGTDSTVMTFPTTNATIARTDVGQTFTGTQAFGAITYSTLNGNTWATGTGTLAIAAGKTFTASNTLTLAGTDATVMTFPTTSATIARTDSAQTFTGVQTFVAPILGIPTSVTLTNGTGLPAASVVAGALANGMTATTQSASDNSTKVATTAYVNAAISSTTPTTQSLTSGTAATYTTPANVKWLKIRMTGAGGGGGAAIAGSAGGNTTFNSVVAAGGGGGAASDVSGAASGGGAAGSGGSGTATNRWTVSLGDPGMPTAGAVVNSRGGNGAATPFGAGAAAGSAAAANTGAGGGGGTGTYPTGGGGGGGAGENVEIIIGSPAATYTYTITAGGAAGSGGDAGAGGSGFITVEEHYNA